MVGEPRRSLTALAAAGVMALTGGSIAIANSDHGTTTQRAGVNAAHKAKAKATCEKGRFSAWDEQWLMMSISGDRFEIAGGKLAQAQGTDAKIKALGARLVKDHTMSLSEAEKVARALGIEVPSSPTPSMQWELKAVAKFTGNQFDRAYADLEVLDHRQDIQEARDEVSDGCNAQIRKLAREDLPVLEEHLRLAQQAQQTVGTF